MNACTIDVEDYYHVSAFECVIDRSQWSSFESRVEASTHRILETLAKEETTATFFILGWVAQAFPDLVRQIHKAGHEIGCHSNEHRLVYAMTPEAFRDDLRRSRDLLQDIAGCPVVAYRAPSFSITRRSMFALEILVEEGFRYDSSVFPVLHDRYGVPNAPIDPYVVETASGPIVEFPPTVKAFGKANLPVAGGGYFRLYPFAFTSFCVRSINRAGRPVNLYLHPWEFDPQQPRIKQAPLRSRLRHYVNLKSTEAKFARLLRQAAFDTLTSVADARRDSLPTYDLADGALTRREAP